MNVEDGYDAIVVGSGFGGAVVACRLAERKMKVLVLERGRRWAPKDYPRKPDDPWIFDANHPARRNGWLDIRVCDDMTVVQGAGVGGGSLVYANVSVEAKPEVFEQGWPPEITYSALKPYYDRVGRMLNVQTLPERQASARYQLMKEGAARLGYGARFRALPVAVSFDPDWHYGLPDPHSDRHSKRWTNAQGKEQGTCVHCGNCDIGCPVGARNTLDLNYLASAEQHGAEIRPLHLVRAIRPNDGGYGVEFDRIQQGRLVRGRAFAKRVILAAGSFGSTELLLRCRDEHKTLPGLGPFLGRNWSSNGDFLTPAFYDSRTIAPSRGPTITCAIDFLDGSVDGQQFFIEDGGFPDLMGEYLNDKRRSRSRKRRYRALLRELNRFLGLQRGLDHVMPWFAQGIDAADGRLYLGRRWWMPWRRTLKLDWDIDRSEQVVNAIVNMHKRLAASTGGKPWVPPTWTLLRNLVTPHPLGGCNMGTSPENGVVDHRGAVFGYPNLYVADGAIVPEAIGLNPSRTIAALAERIAELIP